MGNAISSCFKKYATFSGRATRSEYWFFTLFTLIVYFGAAIIDAALGSYMLTALTYLIFLIPGIAVGCRRLHDTGKSGWFILVPIYNFVLTVTESQKKANRFGALA